MVVRIQAFESVRPNWISGDGAGDGGWLGLGEKGTRVINE